MATSKDAQFDQLLKDIPPPGGVKFGFPWRTRLNIESSENPRMTFDKHSFTQDKAELSGRVKVDDSTSVQKTLGGPFVEHDAPTGIVPSTIFTPFPRDMFGIDWDYFEIAAMATMAAAMGALTAGLVISAE